MANNLALFLISYQGPLSISIRPGSGKFTYLDLLIFILVLVLVSREGTVWKLFGKENSHIKLPMLVGGGGEIVSNTHPLKGLSTSF